jgi:hypothetical protein
LKHSDTAHRAVEVVGILLHGNEVMVGKFNEKVPNAHELILDTQIKPFLANELNDPEDPQNLQLSIRLKNSLWALSNASNFFGTSLIKDHDIMNVLCKVNAKL